MVENTLIDDLAEIVKSGGLSEEGILKKIREIEKTDGVLASVRLGIYVTGVNIPDLATSLEFGNLDSRPVVVRWDEIIHPKYEHDVRLIEGTYENLGYLQLRIDELGTLRFTGKIGEPATDEVPVDVPEPLLEAVRKFYSELGLKPPQSRWHQHFFDPEDGPYSGKGVEVPVDEMYDFVKGKGVECLKYNLEPRLLTVFLIIGVLLILEKL